MNIETLEKKLHRAKAEISGLEQMIETKTRDLFLSRESLRQSITFQENVLKAMTSALVVLDPKGCVVQANQSALEMLNRTSEELKGTTISEIAAFPERGSEAQAFIFEGEVEIHIAGGTVVPTLFSSSVMSDSSGVIEGYVCVWSDLREKRQLEVELRHAQKLESLGQMAAGVAHEINTPIQFVGDSFNFLQEAFEDLQGVVKHYRDSRENWGLQEENSELAAKAIAFEEEADLEFIEEEAPGAFERVASGLSRVATIVKALKSFSHPGSSKMTLANLNDIIETTLTLTNNEYKYVADLDVKLEELPDVSCHPGDMGQVFLNLIVNAAHAIDEKLSGSGEQGTIRISTAVLGGGVVIEIEDSGAGISDEIVGRIFDPFFTTKEVGKGTGQGLSLVRRIIVDKHKGQLSVDSTLGQGTTFRIELPIKREAKAA
jgi:two-component system NtrC family sensor kinase